MAGTENSTYSSDRSFQPDAIYEISSIAPRPSEREKMRMEFYQTYDVNTGIRIAATLGGFFGLMVLLVIYKSKCKSQPDENLEAAISAAVDAEEEEQLEATLNQNLGFGCPRQSLSNTSIPGFTRFSSVGGGHGLMAAPSCRQYDFGSRTSRAPMWDISFRHHTTAPTPPDHETRSPRSSQSHNEDNDIDSEEEDQSRYKINQHFLQVPNRGRKLSSLMESNSDFFPNSSEINKIDSCSTNSCFIHEGLTKESRFPINIQVIQPTPQITPSGSISGLYESNESERSNYLTQNTETSTPLLSARGTSSIIGSESEMRSIGSDSVFISAENDSDSIYKQKCANHKSSSQISDSTMKFETRRYSDPLKKMRIFENKLKIASRIWSYPIFEKFNNIDYRTRLCEQLTNSTGDPDISFTTSSMSTKISSSSDTNIKTDTFTDTISTRNNSIISYDSIDLNDNNNNSMINIDMHSTSSDSSSSNYYSSVSRLPTSEAKGSMSIDGSSQNTLKRQSSKKLPKQKETLF